MRKDGELHFCIISIIGIMNLFDRLQKAEKNG